MCSSSVLKVSLCLLLYLPPCLDSGVTVKLGGDATLQCRGPRGANVTLLKWKKLESKHYVFFYKENRLYEKYQHPSYRGRVELIDPEMKDGDVSVILKNVNVNDAGRYECHVGNTGGDLKFIRSIDLKVQETILAEPGQSVSLPCQAPNNTEIIAVEWTRPELEPGYVLLYRDGWSDLYNQHPSYQNRVELKDREMKDGDVSMILKNVTSNDTGTYECRVFQRKTIHRKRSADIEPICTFKLKVHQSGDEGLHVGLGVVLTVSALLVVVFAFIIYNMFKPVETAEKQPGSRGAETQSKTQPDKRDVGQRLPEKLSQRRGQRTIL